MNEKRRGIWKTVVLAVLFMSAQVLLKEDGKVFAVWWLSKYGNCTVYACGLSCKHRCTGSCLLGCLDCVKETKDKGQNVLEIYNRMVPDSAG